MIPPNIKPSIGINTYQLDSLCEKKTWFSLSYVDTKDHQVKLVEKFFLVVWFEKLIDAFSSKHVWDTKFKTAMENFVKNAEQCPETKERNEKISKLIARAGIISLSISAPTEAISTQQPVPPKEISLPSSPHETTLTVPSQKATPPLELPEIPSEKALTTMQPQESLPVPVESIALPVSHPLEKPEKVPQRMIQPDVISPTEMLPKSYTTKETSEFFHALDSSKLQKISSKTSFSDRTAFIKNQWTPPPPIIGYSKELVPEKLLEHLMRKKRATAFGTKYMKGEAITNGEAIAHTFISPICAIKRVGDIHYAGGGKVNGKLFGDNQVRPLLMSDTVQPDFERDKDSEVVMRIVGLQENIPLEGTMLPENFEIPSASQKSDPKIRNEYDERLCKHMIYHLTSEHRLPSVDEIRKNRQRYEVLSFEKALSLLKNAIEGQGVSLVDKFINIEGENRIVSLEAFFNLYIHRIRSEFVALEAAAPQGYIYTMSQASIFAKHLGGKEAGGILMNLLHILAFKQMAKEESHLFDHLKFIGFNNYLDRQAIPLLRKIFPGLPVNSTEFLYPPPSGKYVCPKGLEGCVVVDHNNSDAFGQNIKNESGAHSKDAIVGQTSDACMSLEMDRPDLLSFLIPV